MAQPIWKDYYFTVPATSADYRVRIQSLSGTIIYEGKAYARPNESSIKIRINDIAADYIRQSLPVVGLPFDASAFSTVFYLEYSISGSWTSAGNVTFDWDWSHDHNFLAATDGYSFPITDKVQAFQFLPVTISAASTTAVVTSSDGTAESVSLTAKRPADFEDDADDEEAIFEQIPLGAAILDLSQYPDAVSVTVAGRTWKVEDCSQYVLYYVNEYGGWDSLLLEGRSVRSSAYERNTARHDYNNADSRTRGESNYINEVQRNLTLRTGWVSDEGARRMHHLVGSTMVYLHDFAQNLITPIVIDDTECVEKSIASEGGIVAYEIIAHIAREKAIR